MSKPIFAYGILQFREVQKLLFGRILPMMPATLLGYTLLSKPSVDGIMGGPGIMVAQFDSVSGNLLMGLDDAVLAIVDRLEQNYDRTIVNTSVTGGFMEAYVYLPKDISIYEQKPWDIKTFTRTSLPHYLEVKIPEILKSFAS